MSIQKNSFYVFVAELVNTTYCILVKIPVYQLFFLFGAELFILHDHCKKVGAPTSFYNYGVPVTPLYRSEQKP